jgi:hypothetical protein
VPAGRRVEHRGGAEERNAARKRQNDCVVSVRTNQKKCNTENTEDTEKSASRQPQRKTTESGWDRANLENFGEERFERVAGELGAVKCGGRQFAESAGNLVRSEGAGLLERLAGEPIG